MFYVYSIRIDDRGVARCHCFRKNITKEAAENFVAARNANPNRSVKYFIVAEKNINKFFAWAEQVAKPYREKYEIEAMRKNERWNYSEKMAYRGYKCADVLEFINKK